MATNIQSNPVYYSLSSLSTGQNPSSRTVTLQKRSDHNGFGVYLGEDVPSGLYVVTVERNSPAADANIQPGDRVLAVNGQLVSSMSGNPKESVVRAANQSDSLTLTIYSTDIFDTLNIPLTNSYANANKPSKEQHIPKQLSGTSTDLESYIRSLFGNENIQIVSASTSGNNNEFIIKSDSNDTSSMDFNSLPMHQSYTSGYKHDQNREERRRRRRDRRQTRLVTQGTQTPADNNENHSSSKEQSQASPLRPNSSHPSMGTQMGILRAQQPNPAINSYDGKSSPPRQSTATQHSPILDEHINDYKTKPSPKVSHMVDIVGSAITASRGRDQPNNSERTSSHGPPPSSNVPPATSAPPSRDQAGNNSRNSAGGGRVAPPPSNPPTNTPSRDQAGTNSRDPGAGGRGVPPPSNPPTNTPSRDQTGKSSRDSATGPSEGTIPSRNQNPPPPYTTVANMPIPLEPKNNYNVPEATENRAAATRNPETTNVPSAIQDEGFHEVRLHRSPDFQGFGFHLQYNKRYYLVQRVEENSPADAAGLRANDVIHKINQQTTDKMPHNTFVQIVNDTSEVVFLVQSHEQYLRSNPVLPRNPQLAATVSNAINDEGDKRKSGISKALGKLTSN